MAKYNDEIWLDETPFSEGVHRQILEETAPYTFKRDKRTGWETRTFVLDEVSGENAFGTLRDLNKAVYVVWERPTDQLTEYYNKPGWKPKRRRR